MSKDYKKDIFSVLADGVELSRITGHRKKTVYRNISPKAPNIVFQKFTGSFAFLGKGGIK